MMSAIVPPNDQVLKHVVDVHCHPTDAPFISSQSMDRLEITICAMSTRQADQVLVRNLATSYPTKVIPCFGFHPWFSHTISTQPGVSKHDHYKGLFLRAVPIQSDIEAFEKLLEYLPDPTPLHDVIRRIRRDMEDFPAAMLGEVGLDRVFRVPFDYFGSPRQLTPFSIPLDHQLAVLEAQLDLAVELSRNVSFHSVKSQMATKDILMKMERKHGDQWKQINIDMHSCGLSFETWRDIEKRHKNVFLSFSTVINSRSSGHRALIASCSADRILVESDYNTVDMCTERTWDMLLIVADVKGWKVEEDWADEIEETEWGAVRKLERNWEAFRRVNDIN